MQHIVRVPLSVLRRYFFSQIKPGLPEDCWLWPDDQLNGAGYGQLTIRLVKYGKRRRFLSHRVSYRLFKGPIPKGKQVTHSCDVKRCVNPAHLPQHWRCSKCTAQSHAAPTDAKPQPSEEVLAEGVCTTVCIVSSLFHPFTDPFVPLVFRPGDRIKLVRERAAKPE